MSDVWQELKENLVGEGLSIQTNETRTPGHNWYALRARIMKEGDLLRSLTLVDNVSQEVFESAQKDLRSMLTEADFELLETPVDIYLHSLYYQKSGDPRISQKVIMLTLEHIEQVTALVQDEKFTSCTIMYGYSSTVDGASVYGYNLICKGVNVETARISITKKGIDVILMDLDQLLRKHRWTKQESEVDSRGGMGGSVDYTRS